jgi:integrase
MSTRQAKATKATKATPRRRTWRRGTIEARGPDTWVVRVGGRIDPATQKRVRESRRVHGSRRDAERALADLLRERETHGPSPATEGRLTLHDWIEEHLRTSGKLSERTRADQLRFWKTYSTPALRATPLRDVTTALLDAFVTDLRQHESERTGRTLSARTVALVFNVLRAALKRAVRLKKIPADPAHGVTVAGAAATSTAGRALSAEEVARFLSHDPEHRLHALWHVAVGTGLRPGEVLALRWEDLDLDSATLHVRRALVRIGKAVYYASPKAGSARSVPLAPGVVDVLKRHRTRQCAERLKLGERWMDPSLVFASDIGSVLDANNVSDLFRGRVKAAKLPPVRWYDLRHSFGSYLIREGVDVKTVSQLMGHKDVALTLRSYVHPDEAQHRAAVARLPWGKLAGEVSAG